MGFAGWRRGLLILWEIEVIFRVTGANGGIGFYLARMNRINGIEMAGLEGIEFGSLEVDGLIEGEELAGRFDTLRIERLARPYLQSTSDDRLILFGCARRRLRQPGHVQVKRSECLWQSPWITPSTSSKREEMISMYCASPVL